MKEGQQLAAIMFTDIVGYTALMGKDVEMGLDLIRQNRQIHKPLIEHYGGRWLKEMGDGTLASFNTAIDAVNCAVEIQKRARLELSAKIRVGIHLGDVVFENSDVFGDGVNIASRIQSIADPGGIYISESIYEAIRARSEIEAVFFGDLRLKNVDHLIKTYYLKAEGLPTPSIHKLKSLRKRSVKQTKKRLLTGIMAFLIIILTAFSWWYAGKSGDSSIKAIGVLPVENLSQNLDEEWLQAGIHHELIDALNKIQEIRVISRTSMMKYLNSNLTIPEIARELNVDGIVEASFSKKDTNVRIRVRLIQAEPDERQLWTEVYDNDMSNVVSVYSAVAKSIAGAIDLTLSAIEEQRLYTRTNIDPEAYEAYLRGLNYSENLTPESLDKALVHFEKALSIEPNYALAYAGIAWVWRAYVQQGIKPRAIAGPKAKEAADKALRLDSTLVDLHRSRAVEYTWGEWDWPKAEKAFNRTFEIDPNNAFALAYYSHFLSFMGQAEEGLVYSEKATTIDPLNVLYQAVHGMALKNARKYDEAISWLEKMLIKNPNEPIALPALWAVFHEQHRYDEAIATAIKIYTLRQDQEVIDILETRYSEDGYKKTMQRIAEAMVLRRKKDFYSTDQIVTWYARAGMRNETLIWLDSAYQEHGSNMPYISVDPLFDFLREEPQFKELLLKLKLKDYISK
jgi:class 3 adenylate cyclase/TolB-like protein